MATPNQTGFLSDTIYLSQDDGELDLVLSSGELYRAGNCPAPGLYRQVDGPRTVEIKAVGEPLPPSFDGRVACYRRVQSLWKQIEAQETAHAA